MHIDTTGDRQLVETQSSCTTASGPCSTRTAASPLAANVSSPYLDLRAPVYTDNKTTVSGPPTMHVDAPEGHSPGSPVYPNYGQLSPDIPFSPGVSSADLASPVVGIRRATSPLSGATSPDLLRQHRLCTSSEGADCGKSWPGMRRHRPMPGLSPVRGLEKSAKRLRRQRLGMFPSMTDLVSFAGSARREDKQPVATAAAQFSGLRRTKSLHSGLNYRDSVAKSSGADPWQRFAEWRAENPTASRAEARAFVERQLGAQPKE